MKYLGIALVYAWRWTFGLLTPPGTCKYHPSCSQYAIDALREHGLIRGTVLAGWRLLRCNPWSHGGVDYARDQTIFPIFPRRRRRSRHLRAFVAPAPAKPPPALRAGSVEPTPMEPPSSLRLFRSRRAKA